MAQAADLIELSIDGSIHRWTTEQSPTTHALPASSAQGEGNYTFLPLGLTVSRSERKNGQRTISISIHNEEDSLFASLLTAAQTRTALVIWEHLTAENGDITHSFQHAVIKAKRTFQIIQLDAVATGDIFNIWETGTIMDEEEFAAVAK